MMKKSSTISKKIIFIPLILITVMTLVGSAAIDLYFEKTALRRYEKNLIQLARSGVQMLELLYYDMADIAELDHFADTFAEENRFRVTLIGLSGVILGDSRLSEEEMRHAENHSDRPEILGARESGVGISKRYSRTLNTDLLYVALRYNNPGRKGYFRVAFPLTELKREMRYQRAILGGVCFFALIIAGLLSLLMSRYLLTLVKKEEYYLEERVSQRTKEIELLQNLGTQLTACNTMEEAIEVIKIVTSILLPGFTGALARPTRSKDQFEIVTSWNGQWSSERFYTPEKCWALRTGRPHMEDIVAGNIRCLHSRDDDEGIFCIPLVAQGVTHGVLHFSNPGSVQWTSAEHQLASAVAENASLIFASLELRESLRQQAIRDPLTGLYNRRYLLEAMDQEMSRAIRHKLSLGVLMIDLDKFKKFNDRHGHEVGDLILTEFGRLVKTIIRDEDVACRYGGEEFTVLLPETDSSKTEMVAEKIRSRIRTHPFGQGQNSFGPITLSIGAAVYPDHGKSVENLLKSADEALYEAKQTGRDKVIVAEVVDNEKACLDLLSQNPDAA